MHNLIFRYDPNKIDQALLRLLMEHFPPLLEEEELLMGNTFTCTSAPFDPKTIYRGKLRDAVVVVEIAVVTTPDLRQGSLELEERLGAELRWLAKGQNGIHALVVPAKQLVSA